MSPPPASFLFKFHTTYHASNDSRRPAVGPILWIYSHSGTAQELLFADSFDRPDNSDLNASALGKSGSLGVLDWVEKANGGSPEVVGQQLQLGEASAGGGWSIIWVDHNFTDSVITELGEFTVSVDIGNLNSGGGTRFNGFAVGNALADLDEWSANNPDSFASDFFIGYDPTGTTEVKIFIAGTPTEIHCERNK